MTVTLVNVHVKPDFIQAFIEATGENHRNSVLEDGNFRFDVLQDANNPAKFILYEAYDNEQAAIAHKQTAHYLKWRETVADWMETPREAVKCLLHFPKG